MRKKYDFSTYMDNTKALFKELYGDVVFNQLQNTPFKAISWEGLDITCPEITATSPNINERFTTKWIEYYSERDYTMFDLFLHSVFHYGFQQKDDYTEKFEDKFKDLIAMLKNQK